MVHHSFVVILLSIHYLVHALPKYIMVLKRVLVAKDTVTGNIKEAKIPPTFTIKKASVIHYFTALTTQSVLILQFEHLSPSKLLPLTDRHYYLMLSTPHIYR